MTLRVFEERADLYDKIHQKKDYEGEIDFVLEQFEEYGDTDGRKVLDVGCGTGEHVKELASRGYDVTGVDASEEMVDIAREKTDATFRQGRLPELDVDLDEDYDLIVLLFDVINYFDHEELRPSLERLREHLAEGGVLLFDHSQMPDETTPAYLHTVDGENGDFARIAQFRDVDEEHTMRYESAVIAKDEQGLDFFLDKYDYSRFETEFISDLLDDLGFEFVIDQGYDTGSRTDNSLEVFTAY